MRGHGPAAAWVPAVLTLAVLALAVLALAGCGLLPPPHKPTVQTATPAHPPRPHPPRPTPLPTTGSAAAAGRLPQVSTPPLRVVGLSQEAVRRLLGDPAAAHAEGPAQTWRYDGPAGCRVDIAFYFDVTRSGFFALSQRLAGGGDGGDCLARIHAAHVA